MTRSSTTMANPTSRLPIRVKVIVAGDEMTIDYSARSPIRCKGCINSGYYGGGRTTARVAFKYLIADDEPANEGTFRPLKLILPEGKILSAHPTAPMGNYSQPFPTVIDAIIKALEKALARARHRRSLRHFFGRPFSRPARQRHAVRLPRQRPWRLGRLRHPRRRRTVSHHGARRHAHHSRRAAGVDVSLSHRRVRPARRFRRRRKISRRLGIPQKISIARRR